MPVSLSPINQLIENIQGSINGLIGDILGNNDPSVPTYPTGNGIQDVLSTIDDANWLKLSFPYTFSVFDIEKGATSDLFGDFSLPIAPQSLKQTEEFAISIKPTQGGTTVTHSGNKYKILTIKGTTGIHPFKGAGGVNKRTGEAIFQPKELKYVSGFKVFLSLRNWMRSYYEYKKKVGKNARGLRLVFRNYKDGEFLIVENTKFEMDRQSAKSFMYDYDMEFKVIAHLSFQELINKTTAFEEAIANATEIIDTARGVFLRSQDILRQIESTYESVILEPLRKTALALKALQGVGTVAGDIGNRIISNTLTAAAALGLANSLQAKQRDNRRTGTLDPRLANVSLPNDLGAAVANQGGAFINSFNEGLMAMDSSEFPENVRNALAEEQSDAAATPRSFYEDTIEEIKRVKQNAEDFFNLGSTQYDQIFDRTATLSADFTKTITNEELDLLNAFNDSIRGLRLLLSTEDLFKSSFDERIRDIVNRFDGNIELFSFPAVEQIILDSGTTLERLAQIHLGDSSRWGEIAELNDLKAPYIVDDLSDTRSNVAKPGDRILIPAPLVNGFSQVPPAKEIKTTRGFNELLRSLGTDLKLTSDFDLSLSSSGDLEVVSGTDNMAQQVILKLSYEQGELMRYPELGAGVLPGSKFPPLQQIRDGVTNTLLQDNRIERVDDLRLERDNSSLNISFNIKIKQVDIPIPITIKVA